MYLTGFADEAGPDIDTQIRATLALGWRHIESRAVDGINIHDMPDNAFDAVAEKLLAAGIQVNCFGSAIANWSKRIDEPFDSSLAETRRAIPRMQRLGTKLVRIMSFQVLPGEDQMEQERFRRVRELHRMFTDAGLTPVHENCANYGGLSWSHTLRLIENVPGLQLVFDTGNPVFTPDASRPEPRPRQSSWDFYRHVRDHIAYVHVKDGRFIRDVPGAIFAEADFTFPGEGDGEVPRILEDLVRSGYDGGISIEPHMGAVFHDPRADAGEDARFQTYVEYGRRVRAILDAAGAVIEPCDQPAVSPTSN